ncbi:unnamed protein product [Scytosiphon promiscuus]
MTRVKERGLALDPRPPSSSSRRWNSLVGEVSSSPEQSWRGLVPPRRGRGCVGAGGRDGDDCGRGGWRVKLGRAVRLELERSVWLGEGPGQPGSLHLRDIRKALAALARELNTSEGKRLEMEAAFRAAGGGAGIAELEESADILRRRVELLEKEASAKPAVDVEAFAALREEMEAATAVREGLRAQVERLEEALSAARQEVSEASAESSRVRAERDEMEERVGRLDASKLELAREVEQLKAFSIRANLERDECLERERAAARGRVDETLHAASTAGGGAERRGRRDAAGGTPPQPQRISSGGYAGGESFDDGVPAWPSERRRSGPLVGEEEEEEDALEWRRQARRDQQQRQHEIEAQMRQRLAQTDEELRCCRKEEERSRARCSQLEARLAQARECLEEQKGVTASMRRAAARAHGDAEAARKEVDDAEARMSRQECECRRQVSLLEARLLEANAKNSRRRDLLQLQACAQEDLVKALRDPADPPSACGETVVTGGSTSDLDLLPGEGERPALAFGEIA